MAAVTHSFTGKVAIVTGAGQGIGRVVAQDFAAAGAAVVVSGRTQATIDETAALITQAGGKALAFRGDVSVSTDVQALVRAAAKAFGRLDILVNNAGKIGNGKELHELEEDLFDQIVATNVRGPFLCMKYAIPELLITGGCIVNVSSNQGLVGARGASAYSASKHALNGLTKSAALECAGKGVRINAVCPAGTDTEMLQVLMKSMPREAWEARVKAVYPQGRIGRPEDVSGVVLFLCSDAAAHVHGATWSVDGGFTAQ